MTELGSAAFLRQAHRNNWQQYLAWLEPDTPGGWDLCVLTASDERQAAMYRRQLDLRRDAGLLPRRTRFLVMADPAGQRIGSGGATLRVLAALAPGSLLSIGREGLEQQRVLIIHSGGDSRRLPHCSAIGKLFARIPRALPDGRASTLFDEFLISLSGLAFEVPPGVLVASGDVLLTFDHLQLHFQHRGVIGVAAATPAEMGTHHGVYVIDEGDHRLRAYLHKPSHERLAQWDAISDDGSVCIDTGLVWLDGATVGRFVALAAEASLAVFCDPPPATSQRLATGLNLYGDLLMPLASSTAREDYLGDTSDGPDTPAVRAARDVIWQHLRGVPFTVERLQPAGFLHFGTSREYWEMVTAAPAWARTDDWTCRVASWIAGEGCPDDDGLVLINAVLADGVTPGTEPGLIADAQIDGALALQGAALLANLCTGRPLKVRADVVVHQLPVAGGGFVTRVFGLYDDAKRPRGDPDATFMNLPWAAWLDAAGVDADLIWPDGAKVERERTLWNARLYPLVADREESLALSLGLQDPSAAPAEWRAAWAGTPRLSLAESFARADGERMIAELVAIEDEVVARRFYAAVVAEQPAADVVGSLGSAPGAIERRAARVARRLEADAPVMRLRGYEALAVVAGDGAWEDRAFGTLAQMIRGAVSASHLQPAACAVGAVPEGRGAAGRSVCVEAAARIDFGGGWTDTPPYSIERGGTVLNAAVTLHGRHPIVARVEWLDEPRLLLECCDIGSTFEPVTVGEVRAYANPADPFALLKAATVLRGLVPGDVDPDTLLAEVLAGRGGLHVSTRTVIPRGSGLGTSSILAGAVLACLARALDVELTQARLFDEVLCLEQMLTTGGGWQDQVGGLVGGIKLVETEPGLPQQIRVSPLALAPETEGALRERLLLVYTGQQRLAKNLLRAVMGRWMARDPEMVWIQGEIARLAVAMQQALQGGDVSGFGALLSEHWALNKRMDPGSTNPFIDELFEVLGPTMDGGKLAGAGGGGFAIVVARSAQAAADLRAALDARYPGTPVAIWPCAIPEDGVIVQAGV